MTIVCRFNLFAMDQQIYIINEQGASVIDSCNLFDLAEYMTRYASSDEYKTNKYHLYGPPQYAEMIAQQIKKIAASKYNENNIEVEIN